MAILETRKELGEEERQHRLEQLMQDLHITERRDTLGISLSGGERRAPKSPGPWPPSPPLSYWMSRLPVWIPYLSSKFNT